MGKELLQDDFSLLGDRSEKEFECRASLSLT